MTSHRIIDLTHLGYIAASWEYVRLTEEKNRLRLPVNARMLALLSFRSNPLQPPL